MQTPSEKIKSQIERLHKKEKELLQQLDKVRANRTFVCSCGKRHKIKECVVIQTHWYEPPQGCTDGAYWVEGELQIVCPIIGERNRVLFDDYDTPYELRYKGEYNTSQQFNFMYRHLFREIVKEHKQDKDYYFHNNEYFEENRKKFDLRPKYEEMENERKSRKAVA